MRPRNVRAASPEGGFTLLEIMLAMTILAVGSVSIVALFAAAVQLQYKSTIEDEVALLLEPLHAIAQDRIDEFIYTREKPVPDAIETTDIPESPGFSYQMGFEPAAAALPGEGFWVRVKIYPPGGAKAAVPPRLWFIKRQVFSAVELEGSVTFDEERAGLNDRRSRDRRVEDDR